jgi:glutathione S-transferase
MPSSTAACRVRRCRSCRFPNSLSAGRQRLELFFDKFDRQLAKHRYVAGDRFSIADCTTFCSIEFASWSDIPIPERCTNLRRWHAEVSARPSATA